jgi:hypothetical protein
LLLFHHFPSADLSSPYSTKMLFKPAFLALFVLTLCAPLPPSSALEQMLLAERESIASSVAHINGLGPRKQR